MEIVNTYIKSHRLPEVVESLHRVDDFPGVAGSHACCKSDLCSAEVTVRIATGERAEDAD